jgi:hypothetical protein
MASELTTTKIPVASRQLATRIRDHLVHRGLTSLPEGVRASASALLQGADAVTIGFVIALALRHLADTIGLDAARDAARPPGSAG